MTDSVIVAKVLVFAVTVLAGAAVAAPYDSSSQSQRVPPASPARTDSGAQDTHRGKLDAAGRQDASQQNARRQATPASRPDDSWISVSGTVKSTAADSFVLDYGKGTMLIEMDDWDWYDEGRLLLQNDQVRVYGRVDDDLYERASLEASAVYVKGLGSYFYANDVDEEDVVYAASVPVVVAEVQVKGTVTQVEGRTFTLDTGDQKLRVDTATMSYNPLDSEGYQKVEKGDFVSVNGALDAHFFDQRQLNANFITLLNRDKTRKTQSSEGTAQRQQPPREKQGGTWSTSQERS